MTRRPPDILLIILDTLRRDRLSTYGYARPTAPALDALAADATLFTRAVSPAQWTIPAHGSLFTGTYPSAHHLTQADGRLSGAQAALAEILQVGDYHTSAFCNNPLVGALDNGLQRGFSEFYSYASAVPNRPSDSERLAAWRAFKHWFRPHARRIGNQFAQSDLLFRVSMHPLLTPIWTRGINFKGNTARSIDDLIAYWDAFHAGGAAQPLFTYVNLMGAHLPYHPPRDWLDRLAPNLRGDRRALSFMRRFNADGAAWASPPDQPFADWEQATLNGFYDAEIAYQDAQLGRLLDHLRRRGDLDRTVVIIAADHGEGHGEHDLFGHGFNVHQELVHVPLIIRWPERFRAGQPCETTISTRRLFHTILDLAEMAGALGSDADLSLARLADGGHDPDGGCALAEAVPPLTFLHLLEHRRAPAIDRLRLRETRRSIYEGDIKLIARGDQVEALYDIGRDPAELDNRAAAEPELAARLLGRLNGEIGAADAVDRTDPVEIDPRVADQLRALGYID